MPYFFILPAFVVWLVIAGVALAFLRKRPIYPYAWGAVAGSTIGMIVANVLLAVLVVGAVKLLGPGSSERSAGRDALQLGVGLGAMLGPLVASLLGWVAGAALGIILARRGRPQLVA